MEVDSVRFLRFMNQPVIALWIFGNQMRPEEFAGRAVRTHLKRADHVQPQVRQIRQILGGKLFTAQMRVN